MSKHSHQHTKADLGVVTGQIKARSLKMTGPREAILEVMRRLARPLTTREVQAELNQECDLATIYRCMHMLESLQLAKRFDFGDGVARYELLHCDAHAHHHHLICTECSAIVEIEDCFPAELEERVAEGSGFKRITHKLEFFGTCPKCQ